MKTLGSFVKRTGLHIGLIWILFGLVLYTDFCTPLGFAHGILYVPVLIYAMLLPTVSVHFQRTVLISTMVAIALYYVLAPNLSRLPDVYIIGNRLLSAGVLLLTYKLLRQLRKLHQQKIKISQLEKLQRQTLDDFIDALPVQIWMADAYGVVDFAGKNLTNFAGKSKSASLEDWLVLLHPDDRASTIDLWNRSVTTGLPYQTEFRLRRRDGAYIWFKTQAVAQRNEQGKIHRWLGSSIDVDDLRRFREESERLAEQLRHTVESITDAFFTLDHDFRFTYLNQKAAELRGSTVEELLGVIIWEECSNGYESPFGQQYRIAAEMQQSRHFEEYFLPAGKWLEVRVYPSSEGLTVFFSDITEARKKREQLKLLNAAISNLNDIIIVTEAAPLYESGPRIVYVNEAFEKLTGYAAQEVIGRSPRFLQGAKTNRQALSRIQIALENGQSIREQLINYTKSGQEYWLELEIMPLTDDAGQLTHFVAVERNITERIELEQRLRMSQKLEAVGHLTGGVAHDFNNLLTVILGNAEMLAELSTDDKLRSMAEMTLSAAQRGAELTNRLLAFARRQPLNPKPTDLNQLMEAMRALIRRTLPENIELELVPAPGLGLTEIDSNELDTALLNLVVNGRDAMPDGGILTIETDNAVLDSHYADLHPGIVPGEYVMICVSDTGVGMDSDTIHRAFEPFFTTKAVGKGSGLGLSMVFGFTKQSGGHIKIYSEPGEGTSVKLYFPRAQGVELSSDHPTTESKPQGGAEHILIAEDDGLVRQHLEGQLCSLGYRVTTATSGPEAMEVLKANNDIDLLLTDIIMPGGMNGRELADWARASYPFLKVLFTSGYTENAIVHHGRLDPGVELLSKPYTRLELATKVRRALQRSKMIDARPFGNT